MNEIIKSLHAPSEFRVQNTLRIEDCDIMNNFQIGDSVKWTRDKVRVYKRVKETTSFSMKKEKPQTWLTGIVEEILQPGERRMSGVPARNHLSYLVRVGGRLYQPPVSRLEAA